MGASETTGRIGRLPLQTLTARTGSRKVRPPRREDLMLRRITPGLLVGLALCASLAAGAAETPAVARPSFPIDGEMQTKGLVFFVPANTRSGAAAVGTAHTFDLTKLVKSGGGQFVLGNSKRVVAQSRGFLAPPGRPYYAAGASPFADYLVFALDAAPKGVRLLQLEPEPPQPEARVRILGVPATGHDEDDVFGRIAEVSPSRIQVDLDVSEDLRGWGGAPVLSQASGKVIGILQAFYPQGSTARVSVSPIAAVRAALTQPLENGVGKPFASFEKVVTATAAQAPAPAPAGHAGQKGEPQRGREGEVRHASTSPPGPLIPGQEIGPTRVHVEIDVPSNGAVVGDAPCGLYVAGRALALQGELRQFDVIIVIDTSASTADGTGADINGNGVVGKPALGGGIGQIFGMGSTDPGDSILAAE